MKDSARQSVVMAMLGISLLGIPRHAFAATGRSRTEVRAKLEALASNKPDGSNGNARNMNAVSEGQGKSGGAYSLNVAVPQSPQSAALTQYSSYPVGHTTGLPEISINLYTIQLGDFRLPITLTYHASGARVDEVPTCVGLGWTLNAGGAVTRTILGQPDFMWTTAHDTDYALRDYGTVRNAVESGDTGLITSITDGSADTEPDLYFLNAGPHCGTFRQSQPDSGFTLFPRQGGEIVQTGYGRECAFAFIAPDNTEYYFTEQEGTGTDPKEEGDPYTTAWYVSEIATPWGNITFDYSQGIPVSQTLHRSVLIAGPMPDTEGDDFSGSIPVLRNRAMVTDNATTVTYTQKLLRTISWNGNRIDFIYTEDLPGNGTGRLKTIAVTASDGTVRKRVDLANNRYPGQRQTAPKAPGRRMLDAVHDSEEGTYRFAYNETVQMPDYSDVTPGMYSDFGGFYRGACGNMGFTKEITDRIKADYPGITGLPSGVCDRSPVLSAAMSGVLESITFPTGGSVHYTYGVNPYGGGVHVVAERRHDPFGVTDTVTRYTYSALPVHDEPEKLMVFKAGRVYYGMSANPSPVDMLVAVDMPVLSAFRPQCHTVFDRVAEHHPDGTRTEFEYRADALGTRPGTFGEPEAGMHPSLFYGAVSDFGPPQQLLEARRVYTSSGVLAEVKTRKYTASATVEFETGVRTAMFFSHYDVNSGMEGKDFTASNMRQYFQYRGCTATLRHWNLTDVTVRDCTTGVEKSVSYSYDPELRTVRPIRQSMANSDGTVLSRVWEYPFGRSDAISNEMTAECLCDCPLSEKRYAGEKLLSTTGYGYERHHGRLLLTSVSSSTGDNPVTERERVLEFNTASMPLACLSEQTDITGYSRDATGLDMIESVSPGSLKTSYTHKPLFGVSSISPPHGNTVSVEYGADGHPVSVSDLVGITESYVYGISNHPYLAMTGKGNRAVVSKWLDAAGSSKAGTVDYRDGFGRGTIRAMTGRNGNGTTLYRSITYDCMDRPNRKWLPVPGGEAPIYLSQEEICSLTAGTHCEGGWSDLSYDALGRVTFSSTPGAEWHEAGKGTTTEYLSNGAKDVTMYRAPFGEITLVKEGWYPAGTLSGVRTTDEDGHSLTVYTDLAGRKVLERRTGNGVEANDTYFVHNELGQLRYVLTPGYQKSGYKDKYAYEYRYDGNGDVAKVFVPGCGYTQYWRDRAGRVVFAQDETLRARGLHRFTAFDREGRECITGVCTECNRGSEVRYVEPVPGGSDGWLGTGYIWDKAPVSGVTLEAVRWYDGYGFFSMLPDRLHFDAIAATAPGRMTGQKVWNSDSTWTATAVAYDLRGNVTATTRLDSSGILARAYTEYTYSAQPETETIEVTLPGGKTVNAKTVHSYLPGTELKWRTALTVNGVGQRTLERKYDSLGCPVQVMHGPDGKTGAVTREWLPSGLLRSVSGPGFSQTLHYTDGCGTPLYNGSVSSMEWTMDTDTRLRGYKYVYDGLNRLVSAHYGEGTGLLSNPGRYTEECLEYTPVSMPRRFKRHGLKADGVYGKTDNLHIGYDGMRPVDVLEDAPEVTRFGSMDFAGTTAQTSWLRWDKAGNLIADDSRRISYIRYDNHNRRRRIDFSDGGWQTCSYSADGTKRRTVTATVLDPWLAAATSGAAVQNNESSEAYRVDTIDYIGALTLLNGEPQRLLFEGGYVDFTADLKPIFHYFTCDWLGSVRAVTDDRGNLEQTVAYYPSGAVIADLGRNRAMQPMLFNGRELDRRNGLDEHDLGARPYWPVLGIFPTPDPIGYRQPHFSPYSYCQGDPVNSIDPKGLFKTEAQASKWRTDAGLNPNTNPILQSRGERCGEFFISSLSYQAVLSPMALGVTATLFFGPKITPNILASAFGRISSAMGISIGTSEALMQYGTRGQSGFASILKGMKYLNKGTGIMSLACAFTQGKTYYEQGGTNSLVYGKYAFEIGLSALPILFPMCGPIALPLTTVYFWMDTATDGFRDWGLDYTYSSDTTTATKPPAQ